MINSYEQPYIYIIKMFIIIIWNGIIANKTYRKAQAVRVSKATSAMRIYTHLHLMKIEDSRCTHFSVELCRWNPDRQG